MRKTIYGRQKVAPNTFIGGVSATLNTTSLVATKLGISVSRIKAFSIVGSNIQFAVTGGNYNIPNAAFQNDTAITYYHDLNGLVPTIPQNSFYNATNFVEAKFPGATSTADNCFYQTKLSGTGNNFDLLVSIGNNGFGLMASTLGTIISFPSLTTLTNSSFSGHASLSNNLTIRVPLALMTSNVGKPNASLIVSNLKSIIIEYIGYTNTTVYNTAIGGLQSVYANKGLLANAHGVGSGAIINFTNTTTDVRFKAISSIGILVYQNNTAITYYHDLDGLIKVLPQNVFYRASNLVEVKFPGATSTADNCFFQATSFTGVNSDLTALTYIGNTLFNGCISLIYLYMPSLTSCGSSVADNSVFGGIKTGATITVKTSLQTANAGAPDGDLVYASGTRGATIVYV